MQYMTKLTKDERFYLPYGFDVQFIRIVKPWWQVLDKFVALQKQRMGRDEWIYSTHLNSDIQLTKFMASIDYFSIPLTQYEYPFLEICLFTASRHYQLDINCKMSISHIIHNINSKHSKESNVETRNVFTGCRGKCLWWKVWGNIL